MNDEETIKYLANIYYVVASDGEVERIEERVFEEIARDIRAGYLDRKEAMKLAESEGLQMHVAARLSDRIRNLEDMIFAAYCNGTLEPTEKKAVCWAAKIRLCRDNDGFVQG